MIKRFYIIFMGQVQGVGFRWVLTNLAHKNNIVGYCHNLQNGNVEAEIQGNSDDLDLFLKEVLEYKGFVRIDNYSIRQIETNDEDKYFSVKY